MYRFVLLVDCAEAKAEDALAKLSPTLVSTAYQLATVGLRPYQYATLRNDNGQDIGSMYLLEKELLQ